MAQLGESARAAAATAEPPASVEAVIWLAPSGDSDPLAAQSAGVGALLAWVQQAARWELNRPPQLWIVGLELNSVAGERNSGVLQSSLWGMAKTVAAEYPEWRLKQIDLPLLPLREQAMLLAAELTAPASRDDQIALRAEGRRVARLVREGSLNRAPLPLRADSSYLISGGLGDLGLEVADYLVQQCGVRYLLLLGRSAPTPAAVARLAALEGVGATVEIAQVDVTDYAALTAVLESGSRPPLRGVIHAAGRLDDGVLTTLSWERFAAVLAPKVVGGWNLHQATLNQPLDLFILFSSIAAIFGPAAQANHAAANAFLDGLAGYRHALGLPAMSLNWGAWSQIGAAARKQADEQLGLKGVGTIAPEEGIALFAEALTHPVVQRILVPVNWSLLLPAGQPVPPLLTAFASAEQQQAALKGSSGRFLEQIQGLPASEQQEALRLHVKELVARVLGGSAQSLDEQAGFFDLGMDSLTSVELRNGLQSSFRCTLPSTLLFKYPNIAQLVAYLTEVVLQPPTAVATPPAERPAAVLLTAAAASTEPPPSGDLRQMSEAELQALIQSELGDLLQD